MPSGVLSQRQRSSPANTSAYLDLYSLDEMEALMVYSISSEVGQMSFRKTSLPSLSLPSESFSKSKSIEPAIA